MSDYLFRATEELLREARARRTDARHVPEEAERQAGRELIAGTARLLDESTARVADEASPVRGELADWSPDAVQSHQLGRMRSHFLSDVVLFPGLLLNTTFVQPPFDDEWAEGNGIALGATADGLCTTMPVDNGTSNAGVAFSFTHDKRASATVMPYGTWKYSLLAVNPLPGAFSQGGLGMVVYKDGAPDPVARRLATLWSYSGFPAWFGESREGKIKDAASPPSGFGTVPLAPLTFDVAANSRYLVWVWCWQSARLPADSALLALLTMRLESAAVSFDDPFVGPA
jgi:hypothetical protein